MKFSLREFFESLKELVLSARLLPEILARWATNLGPKAALESPIRFVIWAGAILAGLCALGSLFGLTGTGILESFGQFFWIALTLIFTALAEAILQTISHRQTQRLRAAGNSIKATVVAEPNLHAPARIVGSHELTPGQWVLVREGQVIPADGEVVAGIASVDESALTGESAPVIREAGGDRNAVTAGTRVLSDWIIVSVRAASKDSFVEKMLGLVSMEKRPASAIESALGIFVTFSTIVALGLTLAIASMSRATSTALNLPNPIGLMESLALFICLSPTTLGALLPIVGTSGMLRLLGQNVLAKTPQALEAAGNVNTIIIDKTGTLTFGDRRAREFYPASPQKEKEFIHAAEIASLPDPTPEGRSIVGRLKALYGLRAPDKLPKGLVYIPFSAQTQLSGVDLPDQSFRKGSLSAIQIFLRGSTLPANLAETYRKLAAEGATPLVVANQSEYLGIVALRDTLKGGLKERFAQLRKIGVKTIMATGDNPMTAASIAAEAGVDDFVAEATPEKKLQLIRSLQAQGQTVAMSGDGTNDAPAMAQADVALAMNSSTLPTKEACNLIDLDSSPTKLLNLVRIGKENIITIGALTTFSFTSEAAKMLLLFPGLFTGLNPSLKLLDMIGFSGAKEAITVSLAANGFIILLALPFVVRGVEFKARPPQRLLARHFVLYGLGGLALPFIIIKALQIIL